jgi:thiol-disulfide isomerase/thioredoxin
MFFFLVSAISCGEYIELTPENAAQFIGGPNAILVKFYNPDCPHCRAMADGFATCAHLFTDVLFGGMDCIKNKDLCQFYNVNTYPTVHLFHPYSTEPVDYDGDKSLDSFADFVELYTGIKPGKRSQVKSILQQLSPIDFEKFLTSKSCAFVVFYKPSSETSRMRMAEFEAVGQIFQSDPNVSAGSIDCDKYREICSKQRIEFYPTVRIAKDDNWHESDGRGVDELLGFVNKECGTERGRDGLLNDEAGTNPTADKLVRQFLAAKDKLAVIEAMKSIEGAEFYVRVMERYLANGVEKLQKDVAGMEVILNQRTGSLSSLDGLKRRYNVFRRFLPVTEDGGADL